MQELTKNQYNRMWKATGKIVKAFSNMRRHCDEDGMPFGANVIIQFYTELEDISLEHNISINKDKLVECYYSFMNANIDTAHPSYKQFREVLITHHIIEWKG